MERTVVFDVGSGFCKIGYGEADTPERVFPSVVGEGEDDDDVVLVGDDALSRCGQDDHGEEVRPIRRGVVEDWDGYSRLCKHILSTLHPSTTDDLPAVITTDSLFNPVEHREKMAKVLFEDCGCGAVYFGTRSLFSMYVTGRACGIDFSCGYGVTHSVPIYDSRPIRSAAMKTDVAGQDVDDYLLTLLRESPGNDVQLLDSFPSKVQLQLLQKLKEDFCSVSREDFDGESSPKVESAHSLPDGSSISMTTERFRAPEMLFNPSIAGLDFPGAHDLIKSSVMKCEESHRRDLLRNVNVVGRSTLLRGFVQRLRTELGEIGGEYVDAINARADSEVPYPVWLGCSCLATQSNFIGNYIFHTEFAEEGETVVRRKGLDWKDDVV